MDCSPPSVSVHGTLQAKILEWAAMPSSRGSFQPRDQTCVSRGSYTAGGFFTTELPGKPSSLKQKNNYHNPTQSKKLLNSTHTHTPTLIPEAHKCPPTPGTLPPRIPPQPSKALWGAGQVVKIPRGRLSACHQCLPAVIRSKSQTSLSLGFLFSIMEIIVLTVPIYTFTGCFENLKMSIFIVLRTGHGTQCYSVFVK